MSKSPNKHNRIYAKGAPMEEKLTEDVEKGKVGPKDDPKERAKYMFEEYNWDKGEAG